MSYCRWSTESFRCDVYAYEDATGWEIDVAGRKKKIPDDLNQPDFGPGTPPGDYTARYRAWDDAYQALPWVTLTAPSAGKTFHEPTLESFRERMLALRAEGLRSPDYVMDAIDQEIRERDAAPGEGVTS